MLPGVFLLGYKKRIEPEGSPLLLLKTLKN